ncbi:MAG: hypothetical protein M0Q25_05805, partial [Sulfurospirillaceae bacterium]|nr:hypothetical protein [Sulfurospirillaceae bacterium]
GTIESNNLNPGEVVVNSSIDMNFQFGLNEDKFHFEYVFKTSDRTFGGEAYPDTPSVTSSGFSGTAQSGESISGKFYGPEINAVAGDISMVRSTGPGMEILDGTFKATR